MYRLHKFHAFWWKFGRQTQELSAFGGKTAPQAEPRQWLQKENNFQAEWLRAPPPRGAAPMTHPCGRRSRARKGRDLSAVLHEFARCIVFMRSIRLAVRHKNGSLCGTLPHCRFSAVKQIFHFAKKCTTTAHNSHFPRQTKQSCTKKQAWKWHFCLLPAFWGTVIIEGKKYLFIS